MKKTLLMACCFSIVSNFYALKSNASSSVASNSVSSGSTAAKNYLQSKLGPDSKGRIYTQISSYNKKNETEVTNLASQIADFVCACWGSYNIDKKSLRENIEGSAPQYLKKWKRHYLYVHTPDKSSITEQKLSKVQSFLKKDTSGLNGRVWVVSNNTPGESKEYIVEMAAKHNIFKATGKNITFKIYKNAE